MAAGLRVSVGTALVAAVCAVPGIARAAEFSACWVTTVVSPITFVERQITRCRIAGGDVVDYASDSGVPGRLHPWPGTDLNGPCWYYSSSDGNWVFAQLYGNGDALLGYVAGIGGGFAMVTGRVPRCTSEPTPLADPATQVWDYVRDYIHPPPTPVLSPPAGDGVTGLETFVGVSVPTDHSATLNSPSGAVLNVFIEVSAVVVDWGDNTTDSFPAVTAALAGYPDGIATHVYETKADDYLIIVSYDWTARWRVTGGAWQPIAVPNTSTTVGYPVAEVVSVITD